MRSLVLLWGLLLASVSAHSLHFRPAHAVHHVLDKSRPISTTSASHVAPPDTSPLPLTIDAVYDTVYRPIYTLDSVVWEPQSVLAPNVSDLTTLATLGRMSSNAYDEHEPGHEHDPDWVDIPGYWNWSSSFGWKDNGIRGHVFATPDNSTVVIAIKGTSTSFIGGGGPTTRHDKINDNLLFSCCCARVDWTWSPVCDCYSSGYKCNESCLENALLEKSAYYPVATDLYSNLTSMYPNSNIWLAGHSLGGSLASILALSFGIPCVTFEAPAERLAAKRLHLPLPPPNEDGSIGSVTHVWHTADPIPQGVCNGVTSSCGIAGFAMESKCHTGRTIVYDTVEKLGWSVDVRTHTIKTVVEKLLVPDWDSPDKKGGWWPLSSIENHQRLTNHQTIFAWSSISKIRYRFFNYYDSLRLWGWWPGGDSDDDDDDEKPVYGIIPEPTPQLDCIDCFQWEFGDGKDFQ